MSCDALRYRLVACLTQEVKKSHGIIERTVTFASTMVNGVEIKYSQIDKEALTIIWVIKKFDLYLKGRTFTLISYHKPLISISSPNKTTNNIHADRMASIFRHETILLLIFHHDYLSKIIMEMKKLILRIM